MEGWKANGSNSRYFTVVGVVVEFLPALQRSEWAFIVGSSSTSFNPGWQSHVDSESLCLQGYHEVSVDNGWSPTHWTIPLKYSHPLLLFLHPENPLSSWRCVLFWPLTGEWASLRWLNMRLLLILMSLMWCQYRVTDCFPGGEQTGGSGSVERKHEPPRLIPPQERAGWSFQNWRCRRSSRSTVRFANLWCGPLLASSSRLGVSERRNYRK